jgi:hypothetical protein
MLVSVASGMDRHGGEPITHFGPDRWWRRQEYEADVPGRGPGLNSVCEFRELDRVVVARKRPINAFDAQAQDGGSGRGRHRYP